MDYLKKQWGGIATVTKQELLANTSYWREALYDRKMLILRGIGQLSMDELWDLHQVWGKPWVEEEYKHTTEKCRHETPGKTVTAYGNIITKESIGNRHMPWHRDIPWHRSKRYPIRSLYPVKMTNGAGNTGTRFCDADVLWERLNTVQAERLMNTVVKIQSWYQVMAKVPTAQTREIPLVEQHPHTKRMSVLLNSFGPTVNGLEFSTANTGTWILDAHSGQEQLGLKYINDLHRAVCTPDNIYNHTWEQGDLVLFDNYSGVFHGRDAIQAAPDGQEIERLFWRLNLHHYWE